MAARSTDTPKRKTNAELLREKKLNGFLEQISRNEELISLLTGEKAALLRESVSGLPVTHRQFGPGQVTAQDDLTVTVAFESGARRFAYPNAFLDGFLQTEDPVMLQRLERCQQIHRQVLEQKQGISAADHAMELLKK